MPITNTTTVKTFLKITDSASDALIAALIPEVEADFIMLQNRPLIVITGNITTGSAVIASVARYRNDIGIYNQIVFEGDELNDDQIDHLFDQLEEGATVSDVTGLKVFGRIVSVDKLNQTVTISANSSETATGKKLYIYPAGSQLVAAEMIKHMMNKKSLQSESLGDYSYTNEQMINGYPESITKKIRRYVSLI